MDDFNIDDLLNDEDFLKEVVEGNDVDIDDLLESDDILEAIEDEPIKDTIEEDIKEGIKEDIKEDNKEKEFKNPLENISAAKIIIGVVLILIVLTIVKNGIKKFTNKPVQNNNQNIIEEGFNKLPQGEINPNIDDITKNTEKELGISSPNSETKSPENAYDNFIKFLKKTNKNFTEFDTLVNEEVKVFELFLDGDISTADALRFYQQSGSNKDLILNRMERTTVHPEYIDLYTAVLNRIRSSSNDTRDIIHNLKITTNPEDLMTLTAKINKSDSSKVNKIQEELILCLERFNIKYEVVDGKVLYKIH